MPATFKVGDKIRESDNLGTFASYVWEGKVVAVHRQPGSANTISGDGYTYDTHGTFVEWKRQGKDVPENCGGSVTLRPLGSNHMTLR